ncbi:hypothetical protein SAMN04489740_0591 [Arthrobacter alpinus]|uniref:Uncharacterized protein n=1 Tax=Arthrobacter alpinus TaxID=656366 RepID=A0A1H5FVA6_9MICC|nr:hypothetical protein [Arthrobacter alpinus]SEE06808.1 hypothetical protein SAMN04489740_0591 [Arthrobacter alpinus]
MDIPRTAKLHLEIDLEFDHPDAVQAHARKWAREQSDGDSHALVELLAQAAESPESALMMLVEPDDVLGAVPGVTALGASMWIDGASGEPDAWLAQDDLEDDVDGEFDAEFGDVLGDEEPESEDDWLHTIFAAAEKLPGLDLERLGYSTVELNPDVRAQSLRQATNLRGAIHWAYEYLIDQLFDDVQALRTSPGALDEALQLGALPPLYQSHYGPLFAQRFLVVTLDLGTALATSFSSPSCLAQELSLKLALDSVDILAEMLPALDLPEHWRALANKTLFDDLDHELLYQAAQLGMATVDVSAWFTPFPERSINPYAANE